MKAFIFPGQGAQFKGMGKELFPEFEEYIHKADNVLGYSIKELCLENPGNKIQQTQYTQPALYVVSTLAYLKEIRENGKYPDFVAGHSVGEYAALFAAGVLDFESGLRLVKKRGELMSEAKNGSMAAVLGISAEQIEDVIKKNNLTEIDVANYNSPLQTVISSTVEEIKAAEHYFMEAGAQRYITLKVSGAFHSRYMQIAAEEFRKVIQKTEFHNIKIPVLSNVTARPYRNDNLKELLFRQLISPVKWTESIRYLNGRGVSEYRELGPGKVLTGLIHKISEMTNPIIVLDEEVSEKQEEHSFVSVRKEKKRTVNILGNPEFKEKYGVNYAYVAGGMRKGISSVKMVSCLALSHILGFLGSCDMSLEQLKDCLHSLSEKLGKTYPYGVNITYQPNQSQKEEKIFELLQRYDVDKVELGSFIGVTKSIVKYRLNGLRENTDGTIAIKNRMLLKVSRPEVAKAFMEPIPEKMIQSLLSEEKITEKEAKMASRVSLIDDMIVVADCAGQTEGGNIYSFYQVIKDIRDQAKKQHQYENSIGVGAGGGIGTPQAAASFFMLGADFIETGSINQCTAEAGTSNAVKDILQELNIQDTEICPYMDMFEMRVKCQVVKKGVFFPVRANKLLDYYKLYNQLSELDARNKRQLEEKYFKKSIDAICQEIREGMNSDNRNKIDENPKLMMDMIFKKYFEQAFDSALEGNLDNKVNFQIFCSSAMGAFNRWQRGREMNDWRNRHVDSVACAIMDGAQLILTDWAKQYQKLNEDSERKRDNG